MSKLLCLDTNILTRFFLADHPTLSLKAKDIFLRAQKGEIRIYLDEVVVAEIVWLLSSFYKLEKEKIAQQLLELVSQTWVINPRKKLIMQTLEFYSKSNLHYIDCWIYSVSREISGKLTTFDRKLEKLSDKTI